MKKSMVFLCLLGSFFFSQNAKSQLNNTNTSNLPAGTTPVLVKQPTSDDAEKIRKIKTAQVPKTNLSTSTRDNTMGRDATSVTYTNDQRHLPLNSNGKLIAVDGGEVDFIHPNEPDSTHWCWTPTPQVTDGNRDINCAYSVPCDNPANRDGASTTIKYFQLVWHVMRDGGAASNISQATINNLMAELNADYSTHNMVFCADPATFTEDAVNYTHNENTEEVSLKTAYNVTPTQVINIYVVGAMGPGGYARFPYDPMGGTSATGGIVLNRGNCWVGSHTLAHEMGHVFGLEHTFAGVDERASCSNCYEKVRNVNGSSNVSGVGTPLGGPYLNQGDREGDWCSDTNPHDTYSYNCSTSGNANGACDSNPWANAPVNNHMSYSFCSSQFSAQQSRRMHCMVNTYLGSWTSYGGGICGALPPVADFVGNPTTWVDPSNVTFTDLSAPTAIITTWTWNFNSLANPNATVTPATFVGQNPPSVLYDVTSGVCEVFQVTLTVNGPNGSDSEVKTAYIEVCPPAGDCDILDADWNTPVPTPSIFTGGFGYFTGVPHEGSNLPQDPAGMYQQYFTPTPGSSVVGAVRVGLGLLNDADDDMTFQVVVYNDDPGNPGFPDWGAGPLSVEAYSPTQAGVPTGASYVEFWVPFECAPTITTNTFHVGVEMFPGDATDELVLITNDDGEGGAATTNTYLTTFCASEDYDVNGMLCGYTAIDFDLLCYPMMGWWAPLPYAAGFTETLVCDTTHATIFTGTLYDCNNTQNSQILNWTYSFASDGSVISSSTEVPTLNMSYTGVGPDVLTISSVNECGRGDTTSWVIPYNLNETPNANFTMAQTNPVCLGTPINFTGQPNTGMYQYTWDFGNGVVIGPGNIPTSPAPAAGTFPSPTYTYPAVGTYYVNMTVSSYGLQPGGPAIMQEGFEAGWPGWTRRNGDALTPNVNMTALGFGTTAATSWLALDVDGDGVTEATSTSWYQPAGIADDWFRTNAIAIPAVGRHGLFWTGESYTAVFPDGYEVRLRAGGVAVPNAANYPVLLYSTAAENAFETNHVVDLSAYAGTTVSIAFRNNTNDGFLLMIDSIRVAPLSLACTANQLYTDFVEVVNCAVQPPVYAINATPISGCVPLNVNFQSTFTSGAVATSFTWNFGDGSFAFVEDPGIHTYTAAGTYFVTYEVCNAGGCNTYSQTIIVDAVPTVSNAGPPQAQCGGTTATLAGNTAVTGTGLWTVIAGGGAVTTPTSPTSGVTGLTVGANTFQWTITNGACTSTSTVTITVSSPPNAGTNGTITLCSNSASANLFSSLGGTPAATGTWTGPSALAGGNLGTYNPATCAPGVYTYTVTAAGCPNATATVTVTENVAPNAGTNGTITLCSNSAASNLFASLGGTPAATGTWSGPSALAGGNLGTYNPATCAPGVYTYTVTGTTPCANATATVTVTENAAPNAGTNGTITLCSNSAASNLFASLGGTPAATGTWSGPSVLAGGNLGTYDPATCVAGVYTYTVTGTPPCANATATVTVTENAAPNAGINGTITLCSNSAASNLFASLGGTPAATGTWSGPSALAGGNLGTYDPATCTAGVYTYTVTGTAPCANATATVTVTENAAPNAGTNGTITLCSNSAASNLFASLGGTPAATGTWSGPSVLAGGNLGTYDPATCTAGVYTYTVTGTAPCANATATVTVTENSAPNAGTNGTITICATGAATNLFASLGGTPAATGTWSGPSVLAGGNLGTYDPATCTAGVYTYTVTGTAPCINATATVTVTENPSPNSGTFGTITLCSTGANANLFSSLGGTPDATGTWSGPSVLAGGNLGTFNPATNLAGVYTYTVTAVGCANATTNVTVTIETAPNAGTNNTLNICAIGAPTNLFTVLGGTPSAAGTWTGPSVLAGGNLGTFDPTTNAAGIYTYTVTGTVCPNATATVTVNITAAPDAGIDGTHAFCSSGATANLFSDLGGTPQGGGVWTGPSALAGGDLGTFNPVTNTAGTYTYTVTVVGCGSLSSDVVVTIETAPNAGTNGTHTFCSNGATANLFADLGGAPSATGTWTGPSVLAGGNLGTYDPATCTAGIYTYTVTGTICPVATTTVTVTENPAPNSGTVGTITLCSTGASVNLFASLGGTPDATGTWSGPSVLAGGNLGTFNPATNLAGVYTYTVSAAGCVNATTTVTVTIETAPNAGTNNTLNICAIGAPTNLFTQLGGTPSATGTWSGPSVLAGGNLGTFDPATNAAGIYTYNVTGTVCPNATATVTVNITAAPDAGIDGTHDFCSSGATANLFSDLGGTPQNGGVWTGPSALAGGDLGTFNPSTNTVGTYTYTVTVVGCGSLSADVVVTIETAPDAGIDGTVTYCDAGLGGDLFLELGGTPDATGTWSPVLNSGTGVFDPALDAAAVYTYTVTGTICANATADVTVTIETSPDAGGNGTHVYCSNAAASDLFLDLTGTPDATGTWSPALTSGTGFFDPAIDAAGTYSYTVNGTVCPSVNADVVVSINNAPDAGTSNIIGICATSPATDLFLQLGGTPDATGTWSPALTSGTGFFDPTVDLGGVYTYTVTGVAPCVNATATITVTITASDDPTFVYPDFCAGAGGIPTSTVTPGGTWAFNPNPADGSSINAATGAITGEVAGSIYSIEYTTPAGPCQASTIINVNVGAPANAGTNGTHDFCSSDIAADLFADLGGLPDAGGVWSPVLNSGTGIFDPATDFAANYTYTVNGTFGCANATADVLVTIETAPDAGIDGLLNICATGTPIDLFTLLGGTPDLGGTWSPALTSGTGIFDPTIDAAGTYTYTVNGIICNNASADVVVTLTASDDPSFAFIDYCAGSANGPTGIATAGGTFAFNPLPGDGATINSATGVIINEVGGNSYTIEYTTPAGPCQSSSTVTITVGTPPNAGIDGTNTICSSNGTVDLFTILTGAPSVGGTWSPVMTSGTGVFDPTIDPAGVYTYTLIGTNGCANATADVTINVDIAPDLAVAGPDQTICDTIGATVLAGNTPVNGIGTWTLVSGTGTIANSSLPGTAVTGLALGTNDFSWTVSNGTCMPTLDVMTITVIACTDSTIALEIPTGFTPDGDGVNDVWDLVGISQYPNVRVEIYTRWGQPLFESDGYNTPWDGKHKGKDMPLGSYYFIIDLGDGSEIKKGTVTIVK